MNAFIAAEAFVPRSPLLAVSIQSPFSALLGVFGHDGTSRTARSGLAAIVSHTDRLLFLKALSGGSWNGPRLPFAPPWYQFVCSPISPLPKVSPPRDPLNAYAAQFGTLHVVSYC